MDNPMLERVKQRLDVLGLGPIEAATKAGLNRFYFYDFVKGKKKALRMDELPKAAAALGTTPEWLMGESVDGVADTLTVSGVCEPDAWRTTQPDIDPPIAVPSDSRFPTAYQTAWLVRGDSLTPHGIRDGAVVIATKNVTPRPGDLELIRRKHRGKYEVVIEPSAQDHGNDVESFGTITLSINVF